MLKTLRKIPIGVMLSGKNDAFPYIKARVDSNNYCLEKRNDLIAYGKSKN